MKVKVMKMQDYVLGELFEKKLYFLLPFYLFNYATKLEEYDNDKQKLGQLTAEFKQMTDRLNELEESGEIDAYTKITILDMGKKVTENLAIKYEKVKEGVKSVMGGQVLDFEAKRIYTKGMQDGIQEGIQEGNLDKTRQFVRNLILRGTPDADICALAECDMDMVNEVRQAMNH